MSGLRLAILVLLACAVGFSWPGQARAERSVPQSKQQIELSFAPLVRDASTAVVNIYTRRIVQQSLRSPLFDDPFFRRFFGNSFGGLPERRRQRMQSSLGSGVILSPDGLIVTNHHVIEGADEITVALTDRREFAAELVLDDARTDLAVLRIDTRGEALHHLELRDSDELEVGDLVLAIGNPFNVGQTVTSGIVSALARTDVGISDYQFFIQTDAAINPGNSGGALISMDGRLIGINTAIYSRTGGSLGIGFAIPSTMVRTVLQSAKQGLNYVRRPWFGAGAQEVTGEIASSLGLDRPEGVLIRSIYHGSPAEKAGLRVGDVILSIDEQAVDSPRALNFRLATRGIGGKSRLQVWRDGRVRNMSLELMVAPEQPPRQTTRLSGRHPLSGAVVANLSPALSEELGLDEPDTGVIVTEIAPDSPASRLRLKPGDRVRAVDGAKTDSVDDLAKALAEPRNSWTLVIERDGRPVTLRITL